MYRYGQGGLPEDQAAALDLYRKAAEGGLSEAQYELGRMIETGQGTVADPNKASGWYEKAAGSGSAEAQFQLAELKFRAAARQSQMASVYAGEKDIQAGYLQGYSRNLHAAIKWWRQAAEQEHPGAQYVLGRLHASGQGVAQSFEEAVRRYEQAAVKNHADALFYLGLMHQAGLGVEQNPVQAVALYREAAKHGSRGAMFYLGNCYCHGRGVEQNLREGEVWYRSKTLAGIPVDSLTEFDDSDLLKTTWVLRAAKEYGVLLWRRAESEEEFSAAEKWMSLAAGGGVPGARDLRVNMTTWKFGRVDGAADAMGFVLSPADSRSDATAQRRGTVFSLPYLVTDIQQIYPDFRPPQLIMAATDRRGAQSISGDPLWELRVKYSCPDARRAAGLNGTLLMGAEFEDRETGEAYWAFEQLKDEQSEYSGGAVKDVSLFVNLRRHPALRLKNWAVAYGHLCEDGRLFGVLTERKKSGSSGSLEEMAARNQFSAALDCSVISTVDISSKFPVDTSVEDDPENTDDPSDSILDSILGTLTGES
jgi:TPR repeat protein